MNNKIKSHLDEEMQKITSNEKILAEIASSPIRIKTYSFHIMSAGLLAALVLSVTGVFMFNTLAPDVEEPDDVVETTTVGRDNLGTPVTTPPPVLTTQPGEAGTPPEATPAPVTTRRVRRTTAPVVITSPPETSLTAESDGVGTPTEALRPIIVDDSLYALRAEIDENVGEIRYYLKKDMIFLSFTYEVKGGNVRGNNLTPLSALDGTVITASAFNEIEGVLVGSFVYEQEDIYNRYVNYVREGTLVMTQRFSGSGSDIRIKEVEIAYANPAMETIVVRAPDGIGSNFDRNGGAQYLSFMNLLIRNDFIISNKRHGFDIDYYNPFAGSNRMYSHYIASPNGHTSIFHIYEFDSLAQLEDQAAKIYRRENRGRDALHGNGAGSVWYIVDTMLIEVDFKNTNKPLRDFIERHYGKPIIDDSDWW